MRKFIMGFVSFPLAVFLVVFFDQAYSYYKTGKTQARQKAQFAELYANLDPATIKRLRLLNSTKLD